MEARGQGLFPEGKDDPNLCLVVLHPDEAEFWDMSGPKGIRYLSSSGRASALLGRADAEQAGALRPTTASSWATAPRAD
ncbi:MAG: pyridoxamine 5'-phosphate oxidase family protein [Deltaproteobacteria bacterium]|nr:pyridoxamine 5'-phosphate oxidase family protein [Deltaproteobacteria bacterium]